MNSSIRFIAALLAALLLGAGSAFAISANVGQSATLTASCSGTAPFTYQWYKDATAITGATSATYAIASLATGDTGSYTVKITNSLGSATSTATSLSVSAVVLAPSISTQPASSTVTAGSAASFSVVAAGTAPFTYQWYKDAVAITGATASTLSLSAASASDAGSYTVKVTNSAGNITSNAVTLTVNALVIAPAISAQPVSITVTSGQNASFSVTASGSATLSYQWYKDGSALSGATSASLSLSAVTSANAGSYTVKVTNSGGNITSSAATLTVNAAAVAPSISTQPTSLTVTSGQAASFSVVAAGTAPFTYQWYKDGAQVINATSATLSLGNVSSGNAGSYTVKVTNSAGNITSAAATLTVNALVIAPAITAQPTNSTVTAGQNSSFSVIASGTAPLSYQWYKDGSALSGATSASLSLSAVTSANAGSYSVKVTNSAGNITSAAVTLTVNAAAVAPSISAQPASVSVTSGQNASFSVTASGTATLSYQWYKDGSALSGATSAALSLSAVTSANAGSYSVTVSNSAGNISSVSATLTVTAATVAPTITTQPLSLSVNASQSASFSLVASGTAPFTYQWYKDGSALTGATASTLSIAKAASTDSGAYKVTVTNSAGSVTSNVANLSLTIEVLPPTITKQPVGQTAYVGQTASFSVEVSGTAPFTYQWKRGGYAIAGATSSSLSLQNLTSSDTGSYTVTVTNTTGSVTSTQVALNVTNPTVAPSITAQPSSLSILAGAAASFTVNAAGTAPLSYQWYKDGVAISGATASTLSLGSVASADAAAYSVSVKNSAGSIISNAATLLVTFPPVVSNPEEVPSNPSSTPISHLTNMSVRSVYDSSSGPLIIGFNMSGGSKNILIRATGPALADFGVQGTLVDPTIKIYDGGTEIAFNDNWADNNQAPVLIDSFNKSGAFGLSNSASKDAALLTKADGIRTVHVGSTSSNARGIVLLEVYDMGAGSDQRLSNLSARNYAGSGSDALIVGFTVEGEGTKRLLIRGIGPGLAQFGVTGTIADPKIEIHTSVNNVDSVLASNDSWQDDSKTTAAFSQTGAFGLPDKSKDAAMVVELPAGSYTAVVSGVNGSTGTALVEVYELP